MILKTMLTAILLLGGSACFDTPQPDCAFLCGAEGACPDGYRCAGDGICKRNDVADNAVCSNVTLRDAAPAPDAAMPDAAMPDAAMPDAAMPDAAMPDAAMPDAAMPDAMSLTSAPSSP